MIVKWSSVAVANLEKAIHYIAQDNLTAAKVFFTTVMSYEEKISTNPFLFRQSRVSNTREAPVQGFRYIIVYQINHNHIRIANLIHTSRHYPY